MTAAIAEQEVARRNDTAVKVDSEIVRLAKIVAAYKDVSLAEYISEALRPIVAADLEAEQEKQRKATPSRHKGRGESKN